MHKARGFTIIELLIVVAILVIMTTIASAGMLDALQRTRQKKSTVEVKALAFALQSFEKDYKGYPRETYNGAIDVIGETGLANPAFVDSHNSPAFVADYIQAFPVGDGWKTPYQYFASHPDAGAWADPQLGDTVSDHFILASFGSDMAPSVGGSPDAGTCSDFTTMAATWCVTPPAIPFNANLGGVTELHCFATDIIWGDSSFLQVPTGKQGAC